MRRTVSFIVLQELHSVIAFPVHPMFWVRLGPTLIGSRFSRASRCGAVDEDGSSCPSRRHRGGRKGEGRGLFFTAAEDESRNEGVRHRAGRTWQVSVSLALTFCSLFLLTRQALLLSAVPLRCVRTVLYRWHPLGVRACSSPRSVSRGGGDASARLRGTAPHWNIREETLRSSLNHCCHSGC